MTSYATAEAVKSAIRLNVRSTTNDSDIEALIVACSRLIDRYFRLPQDAFAQSVSATRYFDTQFVKGKTLIFDAPLISLTSVLNGDEAAIDAGDMRLAPRNETPHNAIRILTDDGWITTDNAEIAVTGLWGYSTVVPEQIAEACAMLCSWIYFEYNIRRAEDFSQMEDRPKVKLIDSFPAPVASLLKPTRDELIALRLLKDGRTQII